MVEKRTCDYTGEEIEPGTGIMYVRKNGSVLHFVDSKAEKNYKLGREPRDLEWTEDGRRNKGPAEDTTPAAEDDQDEVADAEADDDLETEDEAVDEDDDAESAGDEDVAEDEDVEAEAEDDGEDEAEETEAEQ
ncbi:50S ribosomal protein L24e [Natronorubrum tibetense]|uniref:Large ribosomal subunit protein eL24 n=1 Tax=Natronorubrum tibetense GA33 TaxID=1114856 RepID=L9VSF1_9EURY|nr:50S ribosomal protein L24e [Natronorubrum tibetense]ELY39912.1 50S ribosomal protein L24E [Natronorubrum tibetense GA33]